MSGKMEDFWRHKVGQKTYSNTRLQNSVTKLHAKLVFGISAHAGAEYRPLLGAQCLVQTFTALLTAIVIQCFSFAFRKVYFPLGITLKQFCLRLQ